MDVQISSFGHVDKQEVHLITIKSSTGHTLRITNYGCIIHSWHCPDKNGVSEDILLGCRDLSAYLSGHPYFGAIVGRYANRIAKGHFSIGQKSFQLARNLNGHHLHGGIKGFDKKIWSYEVTQSFKEVKIIFRYVSPDMEEGFPGMLDTRVIYTFNESGSLKISYMAETNAPTIVNITNHCYFNLSGNANHNVLDHYLWINADYITEADHELIPTGRLLDVSGTPFDFRSFRQIGSRINDHHLQLSYGSGYDHNFVLKSNNIKPAAHAWHPLSGRLLSVVTTQPGMQLYTGNHLEGIEGKSGPYMRHSGFCLETQHFPDSPNHPEFPSTLLIPGLLFQSETEYAITVCESLPD